MTSSYLARLEVLAGIFRRGERLGLHFGMIRPPPTDEELLVLNDLMRKEMKCTLPEVYRDFLRHCGGIGSQGSVLFGADVPNGHKPTDWPHKGVVFASLTSLVDPQKSEWIVVGENEFEVFAISRDGTRYAALAGGTEAVKRQMQSLDELLCDCLDRMIAGNSHNVAAS